MRSYRPPVDMFKQTETPEITPYEWARRYSVQTIVTHLICSSFEIAHPHPRWRRRLSVWSIRSSSFLCLVGNPTARALRRRVQIALKPASKALGLHRIFIRGKGRKYVTADSTFKRVQVDARARWLDTGEPHLGFALQTGRAPKCNR